MPNYLNLLVQRARRCPLACSLKVLLLLLFTSALYIAVFYQGSVSLHEYSVYIVAIAYIAVLGLVIHRNCKIKMSEGNSGLK